MGRFGLLSMMLGVALLLSSAPAAEAIVGGTADAGRYPAVAAVLHEEQDGHVYGCSGTLIAPTKLLTAAHCVATARWIQVNFDEQPQIDPETRVPQGPGWIDASGSVHPDYDWPRYDIAVLDMATQPPGVQAMPLATESTVERMTTTQRKRSTWTAVGYGGHFSRGGGEPRFEFPLVRGVTTLEYIRTAQTDSPSPVGQVAEMLQMQNTADEGQDDDPGSICFGDSGSPLIIDGRVVADLSGPFNGAPCFGGYTYYQRTDTPAARRFLEEHVTLP